MGNGLGRRGAKRMVLWLVLEETPGDLFGDCTRSPRKYCGYCVRGISALGSDVAAPEKLGV